MQVHVTDGRIIRYPAVGLIHSYPITYKIDRARMYAGPWYSGWVPVPPLQ